MTTNKPKVVGYICGWDLEHVECQLGSVPIAADSWPGSVALIRLSDYEDLQADRDQLVEALERIMTWPDGGNRYGQANIKVFAAEALAAHRKQGGEV